MRQAFVTMGKESADLLVGSIRRFGGEMAASTIWALGGRAPDGAERMGLEVPADFAGHLFARKVAACAAAEKRAKGRFDAYLKLQAELRILAVAKQYRSRIRQENLVATKRRKRFEEKGY
jgi:hypothetical protein